LPSFSDELAGTRRRGHNDVPASPIELLAQAVIADVAHAAKFKTFTVPIGAEAVSQDSNEIFIIFSFFI
jgi:hypothetical protein